ncbi:MAG: hypothetical protein QXP01_06585 [Candidatus Hadarchaeum sp.]
MHGLEHSRFDLANEQVDATELIFRRGSLIDARLVEANCMWLEDV